MSDDPIDYEVIQKRVEKRLRDRRGFMIHLGIFLASNAFLWIVWWFAQRIVLGSGMFFGDDLVLAGVMAPWPLLIASAWAVGLVAHALFVYFRSGAAEANRERAIKREIERERARRGLSGASTKPKRDQRVHLAEDGELVYEDEEQRQMRSGRRE